MFSFCAETSTSCAVPADIPEAPNFCANVEKPKSLDLNHCKSGEVGQMLYTFAIVLAFGDLTGVNNYVDRERDNPKSVNPDNG